jgi:2,4-dienoyl-CoA reductase-like NADH-dependent reductase (Old Yellow Enzyme family)
MRNLFESAQISTMSLANRSRALRHLGRPGDRRRGGDPELVEAIGALARGGVGLIISSHAYVQRMARPGPVNSALIRTNSCPACGGWRRPPAKRRENGAAAGPCRLFRR